MRRVFFVALLALATAAIAMPVAFAASPHLKGRTPVSFSDNGLTLSGTVSYAGLGNFDTLQVLAATGGTASTCTNNGGNQAPGQNPAPITLVGETPLPAGDIKNGNVTITTRTAAPVTPVPGSPGCPNPGWTEDITNVSFTSATIKLFQDSNANGTFEDPNELVLTVSCTISPSTSDGAVPPGNVSCTTS